MHEGVFIMPQEAMELVLNEALKDYESSLWLKAVKVKLSFPQQIVKSTNTFETLSGLATISIGLAPLTNASKKLEAREPRNFFVCFVFVYTFLRQPPVELV